MFFPFHLIVRVLDRKKLSFPLYIARRIYGQHDAHQRVSRPAIRIAIAGVAIGLAVMLVTVSVVLGFKHTVRDKVAGFGSHLQVINVQTVGSGSEMPIAVNDSLLQQLSSVPGVSHAQRFAHTQGILKTDADFLGVFFKGIGGEYDTRFLSSCLVSGQLPAFHNTNPTPDVPNSTANPYPLVISQTIADKLHLQVGAVVYSYFIGEHVSRIAFKVSAIYQTHMKRFDDAFCLTSLFVVTRRNGWHGSLCSGVELLTNHFDQLDVTDASVMSYLRNHRLDSQGNILTTVTIHDLYPQVFQWLELLDIDVWVILALMVLLAVITMISGLLIIILERAQLIGILKALGARNATIRHTFLWFAVFIIARGLLWGNVIGLSIILLQQTTGLVKLDPQTYYVSEAPMELNVWLVLLLNAATLIVSLLALLAPSHLVSRIHPARSMRYE